MRCGYEVVTWYQTSQTKKIIVKINLIIQENTFLNLEMRDIYVEVGQVGEQSSSSIPTKLLAVRETAIWNDGGTVQITFQDGRILTLPHRNSDKTPTLGEEPITINAVDITENIRKSLDKFMSDKFLATRGREQFQEWMRLV